jgi:carbonic anhydrase
MSQILESVLGANSACAETFGAKAELALPPARGFAILTCMDARLDPAKYAGLSEGDAHVVRDSNEHLCPDGRPGAGPAADSMGRCSMHRTPQAS